LSNTPRYVVSRRVGGFPDVQRRFKAAFEAYLEREMPILREEVSA
jgi:hypothetical protein